MRKIDLYQAEPEAILGDDKNMHALKEKLLIDNLLLTDIEADYQRDKEGYREEYFQAWPAFLRCRRSAHPKRGRARRGG